MAAGCCRIRICAATSGIPCNVKRKGLSPNCCGMELSVRNSRTAMKCLGLAVLIFTQLVSTACAAFFETTILPSPGDKFVSAEYRLWIPNGLRYVDGVIVK